MKLEYETRCRALHEQDKGRAGYGGWTIYSTNAKTAEGIIQRMKAEATRALERRVKFYEANEVARKFDLYDQDHVWDFHTYAPYKGCVMHFHAYSFMRDGKYSPIEFAWHDGRNQDQYMLYNAIRDGVEAQCA